MDLKQLAGKLQDVCTQRGNMTPPQYALIAMTIQNKAGHVLIFGAGHDTALYCSVNRRHRTVVLENQPQWAHLAALAGATVHHVEYNTRVADGFQNPCQPLNAPDYIQRGKWSVIVVDGPQGHTPNSPGRQQSIELAAACRRPGTVVFVHDYGRPLERAVCVAALGEPSMEFGTPTLGVWETPVSEN